MVAGRSEEARQARRQPTWYLALLGTDPHFRGRGAARQLLDHVLERCDEDGLPAWTETTNADNVAMYARFGFAPRAHGTGGAAMPDLWALWREPRPAHAKKE